MKIFIQIASYRDPELVKTIKSAIDNAKKPENLVFSIARQFHPDDKFDDLSEYTGDVRFKVLDIPYQDSKGACWARNQIQQQYTNEKYTLQIDSHMRFAPNWDDEMIKMIKQLQKKGHKKPTIMLNSKPLDKLLYLDIETIPGWQNLTEPVTSRFYSAHFCFTLGQFAKEVQHDPDYYFHGEEISIAARAYTHGYDLFHPHKTLIWHEYTRKGRTKQWDDDKKWVERNSFCHKKNRALFGMDDEPPMDHGKYGFGKVRTLRDYEKYSGLLFSRRAVQQETIDKKYPPNTYNYTSEEEWMDSFASIFKHCIDIGYSQVPENDYDFWAVAFHDENDETVFRKDADPSEVQRMKNDPDGYCKVWREFQTTKKPKYWVVWPHSESKGWGQRITGNL